jgi:hypothetical protein
MPAHIYYSKIRRILVVMSLIVAACSAAVSVSYGQTSGWTQPVPLSAPNLWAWFPDVTTDRTGTVHVVWASAIVPASDDASAESFDTIVYDSKNQDSQDWAKAVDVIAFKQSNEATRPAILVDIQGILHLTCRYTSVFYSYVPADSGSVVSAWRPLRQVSSFQVAYFSRLAIDSQGRLHLVYTENVPSTECPVCFHLFYRWSDNNGISWSNLVDVSNLPTGSAKPQILIDKQDYIHLVWEAGQGGAYGQLTDPTKVMYAVSYDRGKTWTTPVEFIAPGGIGKNITIGLDSRGKLVIAWLDETQDAIYYQISSDQGRSWSPPQLIPGVWGGWSVYAARLDDYAMATDSAGDVHLVLVGRTARDQKSLGVLHLRWDGSTWSQPEVIASYIGDVAEWPRVAVSDGNQLHVVWYVRDAVNVWNTVDKSKPHRIWYAQGSSSAPALTPVPWPTHTPTPKPTPAAIGPIFTPTRIPTPTPTPDPALASVTVPPEVIDTIYTDSDEVMLLVKSLVPAMLVIAAVIFGVRLRKRQ